MVAKEADLDLRESLEKMVLEKWQKNYGGKYAIASHMTDMEDL